MSFKVKAKCCILRRLVFWSIVLLAHLGRSDALHLESTGVRLGFATETGDAEFHEADGFLNWNLPWKVDLTRNCRFQTRLDTSAGVFGDASQGAGVFTAGGTVVLTYGRFPVGLEGGLSPTAITRHDFATRNLGSYYQFTSHIGVNFDMTSHLRASYRFQHMSNGGFAHPNPGLNMHLFGLSYVF